MLSKHVIAGAPSVFLEMSVQWLFHISGFPYLDLNLFPSHFLVMGHIFKQILNSFSSPNASHMHKLFMLIRIWFTFQKREAQ